MEAATALPQPKRRPGRFVRSLSDERLIARVRAGDEAAFEAIYDRHHRGLLSFCRHMLGNQQEAEDAVQHTFIAAYRSLISGDRNILLKAWLYAIARNRSLSVLRARREHTPLEDVQPATEGLAGEVERRQDLKDLLADLQALPEEQRAALVLSEIAAHSHDEIGVILGVPKNKVKALVFQARRSIADSREARETPCGVVQEQLATLHGGALRRNQIRRHVDNCPGCQAFRAETQRQKAAMAIILPVMPALALKNGVLAATTAAAAGGFGAGGGGLTAAGGAASAMTGGAGVGAGSVALVGGSTVFGGGVVASGLAALAGKSLLTKALVTAAVAGGASGGGYVILKGTESTLGRPSTSQASASPTQRSGPSAVANGIGLPADPLPAAGKPTLQRVSEATEQAARRRTGARTAGGGGGATAPSESASPAGPAGAGIASETDASDADAPSKAERKQARRDHKAQAKEERRQLKEVRKEAKQVRRLAKREARRAPAADKLPRVPKVKAPKPKVKQLAPPGPAAKGETPDAGAADKTQDRVHKGDG